MDQRDFLAIRTVTTREEFEAELLRFCRLLGFEYFNAMTVVDRSLSRSEFVFLDFNCPESVAFSEASPIDFKADPVMRHCKGSAHPIVWTEQTYAAAGQRGMWQQYFAQFGANTGVCMAVHLMEGRHFLYGVDRTEPLPSPAGGLTRMLADLQFFVVLAQDVASRVLMPDEVDVDFEAMSGREMESLRLLAESKTHFEIGTALNLSESAAARLLEEATRKMFCSTAPEAAAKALRLKLFRLSVTR
jgi:DNA-binding CsgD family transcriptional regulator